MTVFANLVDAVPTLSLGAAPAPAVTDTVIVNQNGVDLKTTAAAQIALIRQTPAPSRIQALPYTLAASDNDKALMIPASGTLSGFTAQTGYTVRLLIPAGVVVTLSGISTLSSTTSLTGPLRTVIDEIAGTLWTSGATGGGAGAAPVLTITSITGQVPGGTSTASLNFANGAPSSLTATQNGAALTISGITITTTSGAGSTASGTASFTFTTPTTGTYAIVASGTGTFAGTSNSYSLVTSSSPILTITSVSPVGVGVTATASGTFTNGAPTGLTATMDAVALTIASPTITTTSGTGSTATGTFSFTFTNPAAGSHTLVASGTGTFAATSNSYGYSTATATIAVTTISPPAPSTTFTVTGTYNNFAPGGLAYSTDGGTTWTTATATIAGGNYSFPITGGLAIGTYTVRVRSTAFTTIVGVSNSFVVSDADGTISAPSGTVTVGQPAVFNVTVTGTGSPTLYASMTIAGVEQTPRIAVPFGTIAVSMTPNSAGSATGNLYLSPSGGTPVASTSTFTVSGAVLGYGTVGGVAPTAWYDFSDTSTLFADTARTTLQGTNGASVKGVADKSGNGLHMAQATTASAPTLLLNAVGSKPGLVYTAANSQKLEAVATTSGPLALLAGMKGNWTVLLVMKPTSNSSNHLGAFTVYPSGANVTRDAVMVGTNGASQAHARRLAVLGSTPGFVEANDAVSHLNAVTKIVARFDATAGTITTRAAGGSDVAVSGSATGTALSGGTAWNAIASGGNTNFFTNTQQFEISVWAGVCATSTETTNILTAATSKWG